MDDAPNYFPKTVNLDPETLKRLDELVRFFHSNSSAVARMSITETHERYIKACQNQEPTDARND